MNASRCLLLVLLTTVGTWLVVDPPCALATSVSEGNESSRSVRRALLIGIGKYHVLPRLPGPKNDIAVIHEILTTRYGFRNEDVEVLEDEAATRRGILAAMNRLVEETGPDDVVYVHYSGHGSQVQDLNGDEKDDQLDETLLSVDGRTEGVPDITDDEVEEIFSRLKARHAVVVLDSCHSGTATRGVEVRTRAVPRDTRLALYRGRGVQTRGIVPLLSERYLLFTAAAAHERALDGPVQGKYHGFFTYSFFKSLSRTPTDASAREVYGETRKELLNIKNYLRRSSMPEPQLEAPEGVLDRPLFPEPAGSTVSEGVTPTPPPRRGSIEASSMGRNQVRLAKGVPFGALPGSVWGLYQAGETAFSPGAAIAFATVVGQEGNDAIAEVAPQGTSVPAGARAIMVAPPPQTAPITVLLRDVPPNSQQWLEQVLQQQLGDVAIVGPGEFARYVVDVTGKTVRIRSADGVDEVAVIPATQDRKSVEKLVSFFERSRSVSELLALDNPASAITLEIRVAEVAERGVAVVPALQDPTARIRNPNEPRGFSNSLQLELLVNQDSYLTIVDVDAEGGVNLLFPNNYQKPDFYPQGLVRGNRRVLIPDSLKRNNNAGFHWDYAEPPGLDTIRVFAASDLKTARKIRDQVRELAAKPAAETRGLTQKPPKASQGFRRLHRELIGVTTRGLITVPGEPVTAITASGSAADAAGRPSSQPPSLGQQAPPSREQTSQPDHAGVDWTASSVTVRIER